MANIVMTLESVCIGGGHGSIRVVINGADKGVYQVVLEDITSALADEEVSTVLTGIVKLRKIGRTLAQVSADLQAGLSVTV